ncbi:MAG: LCP family protein [bacterium]
MAFSKKKKLSPIKRILAVFCWLTMCGALGWFGTSLGMTPYLMTIIKHPSVIFNPNPAAQFALEQVNILVLGTDVDYNNQNQVIHTQARSDSIFVVRCNFEKGKERIDAISIPRDTIVEIPGHDRQKINAAHALGGPELAKQTVEQALGIQIDQVLVLSFDGFRKLIDSIGGLYVTVDKKMDYDDNWGNLHIHLQPGYQWLDGYKAMGFVRFRHTDDDFHRIKRQQGFVTSFKTQLTKQSPLRYKGILESIRKSISGTVNDDQLVELAAWIRNLSSTKIQMNTIPIRSTGRLSFEIDEQKAQQMLKEMNFFSSFSASSGITRSEPETKL